MWQSSRLVHVFFYGKNNIQCLKSSTCLQVRRISLSPWKVCPKSCCQWLIRRPFDWISLCLYRWILCMSNHACFQIRKLNLQVDAYAEFSVYMHMLKILYTEVYAAFTHESCFPSRSSRNLYTVIYTNIQELAILMTSPYLGKKHVNFSNHVIQVFLGLDSCKNQ